MRTHGDCSFPVAVFFLLPKVDIFCSGVPVVTEIVLDRVFYDDSSHRISKIPKEIGLLTGLTSLQITLNNVVTMPMELGSLTQLTKLDLSNNALTGSIPDYFADLGLLTSLRLYNNVLTGDVTHLRGLVGLNELMLFGNSELLEQVSSSICSKNPTVL